MQVPRKGASCVVELLGTAGPLETNVSDSVKTFNWQQLREELLNYSLYIPSMTSEEEYFEKQLKIVIVGETSSGKVRHYSFSSNKTY